MGYSRSRISGGPTCRDFKMEKVLSFLRVLTENTKQPLTDNEVASLNDQLLKMHAEWSGPDAASFDRIKTAS